MLNVTIYPMMQSAATSPRPSPSALRSPIRRSCSSGKGSATRPASTNDTYLECNKNIHTLKGFKIAFQSIPLPSSLLCR